MGIHWLILKRRTVNPFAATLPYKFKIEHTHVIEIVTLPNVFCSATFNFFHVGKVVYFSSSMQKRIRKLTLNQIPACGFIVSLFFLEEHIHCHFYPVTVSNIDEKC